MCHYLALWCQHALMAHSSFTIIPNVSPEHSKDFNYENDNQLHTSKCVV